MDCAVLCCARYLRHNTALGGLSSPVQLGMGNGIRDGWVCQCGWEARNLTRVTRPGHPWSVGNLRSQLGRETCDSGVHSFETS